MTSDRDRERETRFIRAWKGWLQRPPRTSAQAAAARMSDLVLQRRPGTRRWIPLAAAAVLAGVLIMSVLWMPRRVQAPGPSAVTSSAAPLGKGEILIWLDEATPLYMTFQPPDVPDVPGGKQ